MSMAEHDREDVALAGEYALGLLEGDERAAFEDRIAGDRELAALVQEWQTRFSEFRHDVTPVTPPAGLKSAIDARLFAADSRNHRVRPFVQRRRIFAVGLALAASLAFLALFGTFNAPGGERFFAEVTVENRALVVTAEADVGRNGGELVAQLVTGTPPPDRVFELWLIPVGAERPISLGLIAPGQATRANLPTELATRLAGATLAISTEPPGGSPTGQPTGPVVAAGQLAKQG